jgi:hypothetical protein
MLSEALKVRLRSRFAACDRFRVFSRAFNFGIGQFLSMERFSSVWFHPTLLGRIAKIAGIAKIWLIENLENRRHRASSRPNFPIEPELFFQGKIKSFSLLT